jgi:hypothetical protein
LFHVDAHISLTHLLDAMVSEQALRLALECLRKFIGDRCRTSQKLTGAYDRLVTSLRPDAVVVSFNWDVLLELALRRAGRRFDYLPRTGTSSGAARRQDQRS